MISDREMRVNLMVDSIERYYRKLMHLNPLPPSTDFCAYCFTTKDRRVMHICEPAKSYIGEMPACRDCIEKLNLTISNSEEALDYDARTKAILRIRSMG